MTQAIHWQDKIKTHLEENRDDDSHTEWDDRTFHPSNLGNCPRQMLIRKLGLTEPDADSLGYFAAGSQVHEWLEDNIVPAMSDKVKSEVPIEASFTTDGFPVRLTGRADVVDTENRVVYDFKTRGGWYKFSGPKESHIKQVLAYTHMLHQITGVDWRAKLIYVDRNNYTDVRDFPGGDEFYNPDEEAERWDHVSRNVREVIKTIHWLRDNHDEDFAEDVLPGPCEDCYQCSQLDQDIDVAALQDFAQFLHEEGRV